MEVVKVILVSTIIQYWWFVGVMVLFGIILYAIARASRLMYAASSKSVIDIYITGWIGTPVHEFGHWIFCIIFGHKVKEVRFFKPDTKSGTLGFVNHTYDKKSIYQRIGNFFIGIGPIIVGTGVLALVAYFTIPNRDAIVHQLADFVSSWSIEVSYGGKSALLAVGDNFMQLWKLLAGGFSVTSIYCWIFIYLSICISSHMMLSVSDIKLALLGALSLLGLLFFVNTISVLVFHFSKNHFASTISDMLTLSSMKVGATVIFFLSYACILSMVNLGIASIVKLISRILKK